MKILNDILTKVFRKEVKKMEMPIIKKIPVVNDVKENPENYKLELYVENDEIVMKIKKKEGAE